MFLFIADNEYKEPASILFVLMFLSQHHSYLGNTEKALEIIESALEHTPTLIELYIIKGKILKVSIFLRIYDLFTKIKSKFCHKI